VVNNNVIAFNGQGIFIGSGGGGGFNPIIPPSVQNRISQNSRFDNINNGIDSGGANNSQAFPTLTSENPVGRPNRHHGHFEQRCQYDLQAGILFSHRS
jgi:hypothetical protein